MIVIHTLDIYDMLNLRLSVIYMWDVVAHENIKPRRLALQL